MKMKVKTPRLLMIAIVLTSVLMTCTIVTAKPLYGEMALGNPSRPDDDLGRNTWSGEITGDITGDMHFYKTDGKNVGNVRHYWEIWLITDSQGEMLLMGTDKGVWSPANYKYRMNGVVTDAAPSYEYLIGHNVHMSGDIIPGPDEWLGPGVFRVN